MTDDTLDEAEAIAWLDRWLPGGPASDDATDALAPDGWAACACDGEDRHPELGIVDLASLRPCDEAGYDPERALADGRRAAEVETLRDGLAGARRESIRLDAHGPAPTVVRGYRDAFGQWPRGWPRSAA